jgi:hypothetical protein
MAEQQHATLAKHVQSDTRAINEQPVELDGSAVITPEDVMKRRNAKEVEQATEVCLQQPPNLFFNSLLHSVRNHGDVIDTEEKEKKANWGEIVCLLF